jgi:hypothetical protein
MPGIVQQAAPQNDQPTMVVQLKQAHKEQRYVSLSCTY